MATTLFFDPLLLVVSQSGGQGGLLFISPLRNQKHGTRIRSYKENAGIFGALQSNTDQRSLMGMWIYIGVMQTLRIVIGRCRTEPLGMRFLEQGVCSFNYVVWAALNLAFFHYTADWLT